MSLPITPGTWVLDGAHTHVGFSVRHLGVSKVRGQFTSAEGSLTVGETLGDVRLDVSIDLGSIDTGNEDRDAHVRSADILSAGDAKMTYVSTSVEQRGDDYVVVGDLTINGVTKPVTLTVDFEGAETNPFTQGLHAGFAAKGELSRGDFGINFNVPLAGDKVLLSDTVKLELEAEFVAPVPATV
jgi:polyisoprenoid-binding protein YceI